MNQQDFISNAIKTESVVEEAKVDAKLLTSTLQLFVETTEILDSIKKKVFYGNDAKYDETVLNSLTNITKITYDLGFAYERLKEGVFNEEYPAVNTRILHGVIGIATEAGELVECLLKSLLDGSELDVVNLKEEMFDADWYKAVISDECGIEWDVEWDRIINKLKHRYGDKFSSEAATNRDLKKEREILES